MERNTNKFTELIKEAQIAKSKEYSEKAEFWKNKAESFELQNFKLRKIIDSQHQQGLLPTEKLIPILGSQDSIVKRKVPENVGLIGLNKNPIPSATHPAKKSPVQSTNASKISVRMQSIFHLPLFRKTYNEKDVTWDKLEQIVKKMQDEIGNARLKCSQKCGKDSQELCMICFLSFEQLAIDSFICDDCWPKHNCAHHQNEGCRITLEVFSDLIEHYIETVLEENPDF